MFNQQIALLEYFIDVFVTMLAHSRDEATCSETNACIFMQISDVTSRSITWK